MNMKTIRTTQISVYIMESSHVDSLKTLHGFTVYSYVRIVAVFVTT